MIRRWTILLLIFILIFPAAAIAQSSDWLSYYPSVVRLRGRLLTIFKYGKPTYGENPDKDEKVMIPVLVLITPVRVRARKKSSVNNESITNISFVQVIFPPEVTADYSNHLDQDIVIAGTLVRGHKGEHFTDVVLTAKAINPSGKPL